MNCHLLPRLSLLLLASWLPATAFAQSAPAADARLRELDVSAGRWVYRGHFLHAKGPHASTFTWHEECHWSVNRVFMLCTFSNTWDGKHVDSVVVDTYDSRGDTFWHYEIFDSGDSAGKPFAARMRIDGATRIEYWSEAHKGKSVSQRIVYEFLSDDKVTVQFQRSTVGGRWKTEATGTGERVRA